MFFYFCCDCPRCKHRVVLEELICDRVAFTAGRARCPNCTSVFWKPEFLNCRVERFSSAHLLDSEWHHANDGGPQTPIIA